MSSDGLARDYLEAVARELRVGRRYRRRALAEIAAHIEDAAERERRRGASAEEAEWLAIQRLGTARTVADGFSAARRCAVGHVRERALKVVAYLGAALVVSCAFLAIRLGGDGDRHLGLEAGAAVAAAMSVVLVEGWEGASNRKGAVLAVVVGLWIAASVVLVGEGDVEFCGRVLAGVVGAGCIVHGARRTTRWRLRRGDS